MIYFLFTNCIAVLRRSCATVRLVQSHSPINLKSLEAGGRGGMMVSVFFNRCVRLCCLLCCARSDVGWNGFLVVAPLVWRVWNKLSYVGFSIKNKMADLNTCTCLGFSIKNKIRKSGGLLWLRCFRNLFPARKNREHPLFITPWEYGAPQHHPPCILQRLWVQ